MNTIQRHLSIGHSLTRLNVALGLPALLLAIIVGIGSETFAQASETHRISFDQTSVLSPFVRPSVVVEPTNGVHLYGESVVGDVGTLDTSVVGLELAWTSAEADRTRSVAWGDWDNDGDLDLAEGSGGDLTVIGFVSIRVYENLGGSLRLAWSSAETNDTTSLAWGDWDNDGDLDLAIGGWETPTRVYANLGVRFELAWSVPPSQDLWTKSVAWGDWDKDGDLDLALGNGGDMTRQPIQIFRNTSGNLDLAWTSPLSDYTNSIAWGDWDNDGDLDLAVGNGGPPQDTGWSTEYAPNRVYTNTDGTLQLAWTSAQKDQTRSVAWGDWDSDGDLDLAVGNGADGTDALVSGYVPSRVYVNTGGNLQLAWSTPEMADTYSVSWGDWDGDGDLDLAVGNGGGQDPLFPSGGQPNRVYRNMGGALQLAWTSPEQDPTDSLAWGDWDNDGDLDLAVGNGVKDGTNQPNRVYRNTGGRLEAIGTLPSENEPNALAWGDWDGDGDLDLAVAYESMPNRVYSNVGGQLGLAWSASITELTRALAWADWDSDGDLDLAVGNDGAPIRVYSNHNDQLTQAWSSSLTAATRTVAWGDWDGDGDLDLAVGNAGQASYVYANVGGNLELAWTTPAVGSGALAWGDWEGDGDLDLAVGARAYANLGNRLELAWSAAEQNDTNSISWRDWDNDGDLDLAVGNDLECNRVYVTEAGGMRLAWSGQGQELTTGVAWGDWDNDGDPDLAVGNGWDFFYGHVPSRIFINRGGNLELSMELGNGMIPAWGDWDGDGDLDLAIGRALFRNHTADNPVLPDSPAVARITHPDHAAAPFLASATIHTGPTLPITYTLVDRDSHPVRIVKGFYSLDGGSHWQPAVPTAGTRTTNLAASLAGVVHMFVWDVYASDVFGASDNVVFRLDAYQGYAGAGPYQRVYQSAQTLPFRLRGSQVRVARENGVPAPDAVVYRQPAGQTSAYQPYLDLFGRPYRTNSAGYLPGYGTVGIGDHLVALVPITTTSDFVLYYTNATPTEQGVSSFVVSQAGVQDLVVLPANPLMLFDLDISLEWDARYDAPYMTQQRYNLLKTSEIIYDWTNGQAALGRVRVFHNRENWLDSHVRVYTSNGLNPSAAQGGIATDIVTDTANVNQIYAPGQVYMGAIWNRYGDPGGNLSEDWPRTLAHELGHYLFYLDDNYLGMTDNGDLVPVDTCAGAMADPYRDDYSEFHPDVGWLPNCAPTLSNRRTARSDWSTIATVYPWLSKPTSDYSGVNPGPAQWPLNATQIEIVEPVTPTVALEVPIFYLVRAEGGRYQPGRSARSFLFQGERLTDLGHPTVDQVLARGAAPGDRICMFELTARRLGCESVQAGDEQLTVASVPAWQPDIIVSPVTSKTVDVRINNVPTGLTVKARIFPINAPASNTATLVPQATTYAGRIEMLEPTYEAYVQIWVDEPSPRREVVTDYAVGGNPGHRRSSGGHRRSGGGHRRSSGAPILSSDGQVIIYVDDNLFAENEFYVVQSATVVPNPPAWATVVGQGYRVAASQHAPDLIGTPISFAYMGRDVPTGEENGLHIYFWDGSTWERLPTTLDTYYNRASAASRGPGLYALMSSIEVPLQGPGWDLFTYPVSESRSVITSLLSISGTYTTLHVYDPAVSDPLARWMTYALAWPDLFNTLSQLDYGKNYWINLTVSEPITLYLKGVSGSNLVSAAALNLPPATYYGQVRAQPGFEPRAGMTVEARINGHLCGRTQTRQVGQEIMYAINVLADGSGAATGCGVQSRVTIIGIAGTPAEVTTMWDNEQVWWQPLAATQHRLFLPVLPRLAATQHHLFLPVLPRSPHTGF